MLDEIHKWRGWKRWLKGEYDKHGDRIGFLVTGSARLDVYRKGGDSLQGRYHSHRLHPLTVAEIEGRSASPAPGSEIEVGRSAGDAVQALMKHSGFPEPLLVGSEKQSRRWHNERHERFFREDVRDLSNVQDLSRLEVLSDMLGERVGAPLSINSLREDLDVSHRAVSRWLEVFERLYHVFRVRPYARRTFRALTKMPKVYMWDSCQVPEEPYRFENLVALHLLRLCHHLQDSEGHSARLHYIRDTQGREVDFLIVVGNKPWFAVEAKLSDAKVDRSLRYFKNKLGIPWAYQVVLNARKDYMEDGVRVVPADRFLGSLV